MSKDPAVYLSHILECIDLVEAYITGMSLGEFEEQQQVQDAVLRRIEIVGEAVKNLPEDLRRENPQVPWRQIAGTRDKVIHDYLGVDVAGSCLTYLSSPTPWFSTPCSLPSLCPLSSSQPDMVPARSAV